jgi:hypothetical protein
MVEWGYIWSVGRQKNTTQKKKLGTLCLVPFHESCALNQEEICLIGKDEARRQGYCD